MHLTVAICTRNRAAPLTVALEALRQMQVPSTVQWDVLVIDNGSTDDTPGVIRKFSETLPIVSRVEPTKGVANARNRAAIEAKGDYVLWIDDDVSVEADWLATYARAIAAHPTIDVFGGTVIPVFEGDGPPPWLTRAIKYGTVGNVFCAVDLSRESPTFDRNSEKIPWGSNYALRRTLYDTFRYDPNLGPGSSIAPLADETEFIDRVLASGRTGIWVPEARVRHIIPRQRQSVQYLRHYYISCGLTLSYRNSLPGEGGTPGPELFGVERWLWRSLVEDTLMYWFKRLVSPPEVWCLQLRRLGYNRGKLLAAWRRKKTKAAPHRVPTIDESRP